jgi:two-component system alkaline phosphatase synthesis response regulator PhoP
MRTILVVDDEKDIVDMLKYNLEKEGYAVLAAHNGRVALDLAVQKPDLILLDVMMPELGGLETLKELRKQPETSGIPVMFLTAKGSDVDEVLGLELGADDYIIKPISMPKLIARIKNTLRRHSGSGKADEPRRRIKVGEIEIIPSEHTVLVNRKEVFLPKKEFEVLAFLAARPGQVINRSTLLDAIWGADVLVVDRTVDVHIRKIREKLGHYADYIETIKGVGYRMREHS